MTEQHRPNATELHAAPRVMGAPEALQISKIDEFRNRWQSNASVDRNLNAEIEVYLCQQGLNPGDDPDEFAFAREQYAQGARADVVDWLSPTVDAEGNRVDAGRDVVFRSVLDRYMPDASARVAQTTLDTPTLATPDQIDQARRQEAREQAERELAELRTAKHKAAAERMRAPLFRRKKRGELDEAYRAAAADYYAALKLRQEEAMTEAVDSGTSPQDATRALEGRIRKLLEEDEEAEREQMVADGGLKARLLEKYANIESRKLKIAVGMGAAALTAATGGMALVVAGGVVGAAVAAGGSAGVMGLSRVGRTYAMGMSRIYASRQPGRYDGVSIIAPDATGGSAVRDAINFMASTSRENIKSADRTKKTAAVVAVGSAALGSTVGYGMGWVGDNVGSLSNGINMVKDWFGAEDHASAKVGTDHEPEIPTKEVDMSGTEIEFSSASERIRPGEGWYRTFSELGVSGSDRAELLDLVGDKLVDQGVAYKDPNIGGYGILMTPDHQMSDEALRIIVEAAHEHGIHTDFDSQLSQIDLSESGGGSGRPDVVNNAKVDYPVDGAGMDSPTAELASAAADQSGEFSASEVASYAQSSDARAYTAYLQRAGIDRYQWGELLKVAAPDLAKVNVGGDSLVHYDYAGRPYFRSVAELPPEAVRVLNNLANKFRLAA